MQAHAGTHIESAFWARQSLHGRNWFSPAFIPSQHDSIRWKAEGIARNHISSPIQCAKLVKITINIQLNHIAVWIVIAERSSDRYFPIFPSLVPKWIFYSNVNSTSRAGGEELKDIVRKNLIWKFFGWARAENGNYNSWRKAFHQQNAKLPVFSLLRFYDAADSHTHEA